LFDTKYEIFLKYFNEEVTILSPLLPRLSTSYYK
jgi:hypothetical protein